jgi:hypothetical protein
MPRRGQYSRAADMERLWRRSCGFFVEILRSDGGACVAMLLSSCVKTQVRGPARARDHGAGERDRTADLPFTRRPLCQLSYTGGGSLHGSPRWG